MRFDYVSDVTFNDQSACSVQRLGSHPGPSSVDRGNHPGFATRNFKLLLQNVHYLEVASSFNHLTSASSPFSKALSKRVREAGCRITWLVSVGDVSKFEITADEKRISEWLGSNSKTVFGSGVEDLSLNQGESEGESGNVEGHSKTPSCVLRME
jgi:hypothetical protein